MDNINDKSRAIHFIALATEVKIPTGEIPRNGVGKNQ